MLHAEKKKKEYPDKHRKRQCQIGDRRIVCFRKRFDNNVFTAAALNATQAFGNIISYLLKT